MRNKVEPEKEVDAQSKAEDMKEGQSADAGGDNNEENEEKVKNDATLLLAQGKRHLFVKDYPNAVAVLGDACGKLSELFGDLGDECGEAYFNYGRALLELSREDSNILVENETEESEAEEDEEKDNEEEKEQNGENKNEGTEDDKEDGDKTNEDENEDVNNLQLAWEVFELAKVIFERQNNEAKLAETYLCLGEVSLESENYTSAIDDMKKCLDIQKKILAEDNRDIAETLFQLGVACSFEHMFEESKTYYKQASDILETRIKNLQSGCRPDDATTKHPFYSVEKEIEEIKSILPEIKEKIDDVEDLKKETLKSMMELAVKGVSMDSADGAGSSTKDSSAGKTPATNISHLIKKKRKPEDELKTETAKKTCSDESQPS